MSEFEDFLHESGPEPDATGRGSMNDLRASLVTASQIAEVEDDQGDFGPDGYKGFAIVERHLWPDEPQHAIWAQRFYVASPLGSLGVVPWAGSTIIWPWMKAWQADLHREQVDSFLREPEKKAKK